MLRQSIQLTAAIIMLICSSAYAADDARYRGYGTVYYADGSSQDYFKYLHIKELDSHTQQLISLLSFDGISALSFAVRYQKDDSPSFDILDLGNRKIGSGYCLDSSDYQVCHYDWQDEYKPDL